MKKLRFGLLGPGNIAATFAKAIKNCSNAELVAVASHNIEKAQAFADNYKIAKAYASYDELLKDKDIDAVYISVINTKHLEAIKKCIEYKKPIMCEKPIVMFEDDIKLLQKLQKENDILIMEAMWTNFLPITQKTKQWINDRRIGSLKSIKSSFCFENHDLEGRLYNKKMGGGALFDVGVYTLSYAMYLNDSDVKSQSSKLEYSTTGVDQKGQTILNFENGVEATCRYAISHEEDQDAQIIGTVGSIEIKDFWRAHKCTLKDKNGKVVEEFFDDTEFGFQYEISHFADLVIENKKQSDIMPLSQTQKCSHLFDDILNSKK
jgi:predicted dehydrogenase